MYVCRAGVEWSDDGAFISMFGSVKNSASAQENAPAVIQ
jgi:hypothetical protein